VQLALTGRDRWLVHDDGIQGSELSFPILDLHGCDQRKEPAASRFQTHIARQAGFHPSETPALFKP
jgi:hypothetical protein